MEESATKHTVLNLIRPYWEEEFGLDMQKLPLDWFTATDALRNYSYIFPFEANIDRVNFFIQTPKLWSVSIWTSILYVVLILIGRKIMTKQAPYDLRMPLIWWNICMALFSMVGFLRVSEELFRALNAHGFLYTVCTTSYGRDPVAAFWIATFVKSKFVELLDTAFIVLRKKPLLFLHWYHHVSVLLFSWHSAKEITAAGRWYAWMNYGAHWFMYSYYAIRAMQFRVPRWTQMIVTILQISQMAMGVVISYTVYKAKTVWQPTCNQSWANLRFAAAIYLSYFLLFAKYFVDAYVFSRKHNHELRNKEPNIEPKALQAHSKPNGFTNGKQTKNGFVDYPRNGQMKVKETKKFL